MRSHLETYGVKSCVVSTSVKCCTGSKVAPGLPKLLVTSSVGSGLVAEVKASALKVIIQENAPTPCKVESRLTRETATSPRFFSISSADSSWAASALKGNSDVDCTLRSAQSRHATEEKATLKVPLMVYPGIPVLEMICTLVTATVPGRVSSSPYPKDKVKDPSGTALPFAPMVTL